MTSLLNLSDSGRTLRGLLLASGLAWAGLLLPATSLRAQAYASGEVQGRVTDSRGGAVASVLVSLWTEAGSTGTEVNTSRTGAFTFQGVRTGEYILRVEAVGFHPTVVTGVVVRPGSRIHIPVTLRAGSPPITTVDTTRVMSGARLAGRWVGGDERRLPADSREVREALELVTTMDRGRGALGLPSGFTTYRVQGVPFRALAVAPGMQGRNTALTLGSAGLIRADLFGSPRAFGMGAAGEVEVFNPSVAHGETEIQVAYSPTALWTGRYERPEDFTPSSLWGSARTTVDLVRDSVRLTVGGDFQKMERPRQPLFPGGSQLSGPGVEDDQLVSAFALLDWELGGGSRMDFGARVGSRPAASSRFYPAYPRGQSSLEARDLAIGAGGEFMLGRSGFLGVRAGYNRSERTEGEVDNPVLDEAQPLLYATTSGRRAGLDPITAAGGQRQGIFIGLNGGLQFTTHRASLGVEVLRSSHQLDPLAGERLFVGAGDPFQDDWLGLSTRYEDTRGTVDFSASTFAIFIRDEWRPGNGVSVNLEGRWMRHTPPLDDLPVLGGWEATSGLVLNRPEGSLNGFSGLLGLDWTPEGSGSVRFDAALGATVDELDPWLMAEALALDGTSALRRSLLTGPGNPAWPAFPQPGGLAVQEPAVLLLPEELKLPRSFFASVGVSGQVGPLTLGLRGIFRRTERLNRRADLNRLQSPLGTTSDGRAILGGLDQAGTLVTGVPGTSRRFSDFGPAWYLLQDGWSEQASVSVSADGDLPGGVRLAAWYTWSRTTDNLPGLAWGRPELAGPSTVPDEDWAEGTSDLDVPHRFAGLLTIPVPVLEGARIRTRFHVESGRAFTPRLRDGVDLNGDGIWGNDPVVIPETGLDSLDDEWSCVTEQRGQFVERNSCRLPWVPYLNLGLSLGVVRLGGGVVSLEADVMNVLQAFDTSVDEALLLVDRSGGLQPDGSAVSPTLSLNPRFGGELFDIREGRMIRFGIRWGGNR